ncbi:MAG TPA: PadR family transcriptional regulator [Candidatus Acidoferrales bacterium]|nr:PadR family transcriptional regulator [Candidatus Acidoferrales bacterium]
MFACGTRRFHQRRHHWGDFGMMGMRSRCFGPGEVRLALLSLIAESPKHGYELMRQLEERSGGIYQASAGTVYPTLAQLEDEGLIASDSAEGKRVYRITERGTEEIKREDEAIKRIWWRARRWAAWRGALDPDAAEIRGPAERLVKAAFRAVAGETASQERIAYVREILERALRDLDSLRDKP